jgi:hypothetical protein
MVTPRKLNPSQRGRKTANKMPLFVVTDQQDDDSEFEIELMRVLRQWDNTSLDQLEAAIHTIRQR